MSTGHYLHVVAFVAGFSAMGGLLAAVSALFVDWEPSLLPLQLCLLAAAAGFGWVAFVVVGA